MPSLIAPLTQGPISSALNSLINSTSGASSAGMAEDPRSALVFTSSLRQRMLADFIDRRVELGLNTNSGRLQLGESGDVAIATAELSDVSNQLIRAMPNIVMELNPHSIEFDQPKRFTRQDTMRGAVFHHFTNDKGQNNDILTIRFQGNTGNIRRLGRTEDDRDRAISRLQVWHNLYQLTREPMVLSDGRPNIFTVTYVSPLFPVPIAFSGFFTSVLKFTENGKKPNSRDYSMEFIVQETSPDLNTVGALILDYVTQEAVAIPTAESKILTEGL